MTEAREYLEALELAQSEQKAAAELVELAEAAVQAAELAAEHAEKARVAARKTEERARQRSYRWNAEVGKLENVIAMLMEKGQP